MNNLCSIDAVVLWVDGSDEDWIKEKKKYSGKSDTAVDASDVRYRDWGVLRYWFRAIENNMPWINNVYFVTNGQKPNWLNTDYERLKFIKHSDYMPEEYLPTFNSNPIELNLHRIEELSENFILFSDDTFVMNPVSPDYFFQEGVPVYPAALHCIVPLGEKSEEVMTHIYLNNMSIINRHFKISELRKNWRKWFLPNHSTLKNLAMTLFESLHKGYVGFYNHHLPVPIRKSTIKEIWEKEYEIMNSASLNKFRCKDDVSQYLFRYWELARQSFIPISEKKLGAYYVIRSGSKETLNSLSNCNEKMICINDSDIDEKCSDEEYETLRNILVRNFESKFPHKSKFEK